MSSPSLEASASPSTTKKSLFGASAALLRDEEEERLVKSSSTPTNGASATGNNGHSVAEASDDNTLPENLINDEDDEKSVTANTALDASAATDASADNTATSAVEETTQPQEEKDPASSVEPIAAPLVEEPVEDKTEPAGDPAGAVDTDSNVVEVDSNDDAGAQEAKDEDNKTSDVSPSKGIVEEPPDEEGDTAQDTTSSTAVEKKEEPATEDANNVESDKMETDEQESEQPPPAEEQEEATPARRGRRSTAAAATPSSARPKVTPVRSARGGRRSAAATAEQKEKEPDATEPEKMDVDAEPVEKDLEDGGADKTEELEVEEPVVSSRARRSTAATPKVATPATAERRRGGRQSAKNVVVENDDESGEQPEKEEKEEEEEQPKTTTRGGRRSSAKTAAPAVDTEDKESSQEDDGDDTKAQETKKTPRGRAARQSAASSARSKTAKQKKEEEEEKEEESEPVEAAEQEEEEEEPQQQPRSARASGRAAAAAAKASLTTASAKSTPAGRRQSTATSTPAPPSGRRAPRATADAAQENVEDEEAPPRQLRGRASAANSNRRASAAQAAGTPKSETPATTSGSTPSIAASMKKAKKAAEDAADPYNLNFSFDSHPEPMKNIKVEVGAFGQVNYQRASLGGSVEKRNKYAGTEEAAAGRTTNIPRVPLTPETLDLSTSTATAAPSSAPRGGTARRQLTLAADAEQPKSAKKTPTQAVKRSHSSKGNAVTPVQKLEVNVPSLSAREQLVVDRHREPHAPLSEGARVFALFDRSYYPAVVGQRDGLGRYAVRYIEDGVTKPVPPPGIVPLASLQADSKVTYWPSKDSDGVEATVLESPDPKNADRWLEAAFSIKLEDGSTVKKVDWLQLTLALDQAKLLEHAASSGDSTQVAQDNISVDRSARRSRATASALLVAADTDASASTPALSAKTPASTASGRRSTGAGGRKKKAVVDDEDDAEEGAADDAETAPPPAKKRAVAAEKPTVTRKRTPPTQIFANKVFILTSATRNADSAQSEFKKAELKSVIEMRGGRVEEDVTSVTDPTTAYLISDTHYRTHKYLAALARSIPCVSFHWINACVREGRLTDSEPHHLHAGSSLLTGQLHPLSKEPLRILVGKKVAIHSHLANASRGLSFPDIWRPMCAWLGADVVDDVSGATCLLSDAQHDPAVIDRARRLGVPVVSSEWIIQAIIMGKLPPFDAHERFKVKETNAVDSPNNAAAAAAV